MQAIDDFERVSIYGRDPQRHEQLLSTQRECVFDGCTREPWPMGVIRSCPWRDARMGRTAGTHRHRIAAVRRNPEVSVVVTRTGTPLGPGKAVSIEGSCRVHEDEATRRWFYPALAREHARRGLA